MKKATTLERWARRANTSQGADSCWLWMGSTKDGRYGAFNGTRAHRAAWSLFRFPIPNGLHVLHRCDVPLCVNPEHLFLGTIQDNASDRVAKGRQSKGEHRPTAKLSLAQVGEVKSLVGRGMKLREVASRFGIHNSHVSRICNRKRWATS